MGHDWSSMVHQWLSQRLTRLKHSSGNYSCCIVRVPWILVEINPEAYTPRIESIGPYHCGRECVQMIEKHKPRFFTSLISRTGCSGVDCRDYFNAIVST
ncbi:hypothetical protein ACJRO7_003399 [Eucalyptus globulus]|uniref:Uncharacterized protein n=1 Tax=Eucalyptus globulus TaxID=34317 RepID=A0ABD3IWN8_EUCGL